MLIRYQSAAARISFAAPASPFDRPNSSRDDIASSVARPGVTSSFDSGVAAVEFALVLPAIAMVFFAVISLGTAVHNYEILTSAVGVASHQLASSRGASAPYDATTAMLTSSATGLNAASLTITLSVNGSPCATNLECAPKLIKGVPETVQAVYPCTIVVLGVNTAPGCHLTQATTGRVQ
jgi:Flp pilus assembly protein TadG